MKKRLLSIASQGVELLALTVLTLFGAAFVLLPYHPNQIISIVATTVFLLATLLLSSVAIRPWIEDGFELPAANYLSKIQLYFLRFSIFAPFASAILWLAVVWYNANWATYLAIYIAMVGALSFCLIGLTTPIRMAISSIYIAFVEREKSPQMTRFSQIVTCLDFVVLGLIAFLAPAMACEKIVEVAKTLLIGASS